MLGKLRGRFREIDTPWKAAVFALGMTFLVIGVSAWGRTQPDDSARPRAVVFAPACCAGITAEQRARLSQSLRNGAWRAAEWSSETHDEDGWPVPRMGLLGASPEHGGVAASLRVELVYGRAKRVEVLAADASPQRARQLGEQLAAAAPDGLAPAC
jgi:hypothetical protein